VEAALRTLREWFWISSSGSPWVSRMKKRLAIHWQILAALILATSTAIVFRMMVANGGPGSGIDIFVTRVLAFCGFVGDLFMRALKMIIVPLIVTSVVSGIANLQGVRDSGGSGSRRRVSMSPAVCSRSCSACSWSTWSAPVFPMGSRIR
jgi:hypothetical protein